MAVAYVSDVEGVWSSGTTMTLSSVGGSSGSLVLALISWRANAAQVITGVTYGGNAMTKIGSTVESGGGSGEAWYYITSSDGNVVVTWNVAPANAQGTAMVLSGAHASTPIGTHAGEAFYGAGTDTTAVTSETDGLCVDLMFVRGTVAGIAVLDAGQTQRSSQEQGYSIYHRTSTEAGAASVTMGWTWTSGNSSSGHIVIPIAPAAGGGTSATIAPYYSFKETVGDGTIDLDTHTLKVCVVTSSYTPSTAHTQLSDVSSFRVTATTDTALTTVTWAQTSGVAKLDADDTIIAFPSGGTPKYAVLYDDTASGDPLIAYVTLDDGEVISTGSSLKLIWDATGIFTLD